MNLLNWQLDKFKSAAKNATDVTLRLSSNIDINETDFPYNLLLTYGQVFNFWKAFANKTQLYKMIQSGGFLVRHLGPVQFISYCNIIKNSTIQNYTVRSISC